MSETRILADTLNALLVKHVVTAELAAAEAGSHSHALWATLDEMGLTRAPLPERNGGSGLSWQEIGIIAAALGRHLVPLPLRETIAAASLLSRAGLVVPPGMLTIAPPAHSSLAIRSHRGSAVITGACRRVPWGRSADAPVALAHDEQGDDWLAVAEIRAATVTDGRNLAGEPRDNLTFSTAPARAARIAIAEQVELLGAAMRAAQIGGALETAFAATIEYAHIREQFGRPVASFQAIQHHLAALMGETVAASAAAAAAFRALDSGDAAFAVAAAKARADTAAATGAAIAHQVHGAIGVSYENRLQFVTRRLLAGTPNSAMAVLGESGSADLC